MNPRREVTLGLSGYALYLMVRRAVWNEKGRARARRNAQAVLNLEHQMGCDIERHVQATALRAPRLVHALNVGYAVCNVTLSVGWLIVLYRRASPVFARERRAALAAFTGALPVFLGFPTAPPRSIPGFVDTLRDQGVDLDHPALTRLYNPIAAMPSHHVAFAVATGVGLAARAQRRSTRIAWLAYPGVVAIVVVATANHFVFDVVAGAFLGVVARRITR